ncbi:DUF6507 family protein [Arthrobacter sunyaminii]|uniref:Uncharacterized protein n=1 Tax=Arthrobacter sunyaminii TaxID=2816859 RepID=A0A975S6J3_9MICC|nr:DUF6507 family protein [Arthrobacter sunyaminii]MBO0909956.1 hypothetical protein [Arthrobacter sunyaminii]QWQ36739.1 hypothetical protein KG104_02705 [Arthrobacter sunyaminii]
MAAYNIDTAAVMAALQDTEAELASLVTQQTDLQGGVDAVTASLGVSPVARAFTNFAAETLFHDLRSGLVSSDRAVQSVKAAVAEYVAADEEMRRRAEAAAAAVPAAGSGNPGKTLPAVLPGAVPEARPRVEPDRGSVVPPAVPLPRPLPSPPPGKEPEPERGAVVPLPGPPPWKPVWPRKPLPVLPNPLLRIPYWWMQLPWWRRPPWWLGPPRWMRPPWFPGLPRWPHGPGIHRSPWLWGFWPVPGCPCPHRLPDVGFLPPPDYYYPLVPLEVPRVGTELPVAQMLIGRQTIPADAETPAEYDAGPGSRKWGLT